MIMSGIFRAELDGHTGIEAIGHVLGDVKDQTPSTGLPIGRSDEISGATIGVGIDGRGKSDPFSVAKILYAERNVGRWSTAG